MFTLWIWINTLSWGLFFWSGGSGGVFGPDNCKGNVNFWSGAAHAKVTFEAREADGGAPQMGAFIYEDVTPAGHFRTFRLRLTKVIVQGDDAILVGHVEFTNVPAWSGRWVKVWVCDRANPGQFGDQITFRSATTSQGAWLLSPVLYAQVTAGNLIVND